MRSCHNGTLTERYNKDIQRLEFSLMTKDIHTNRDGCTHQVMTSIPAGKGVVSESPGLPRT